MQRGADSDLARRRRIGSRLSRSSMRKSCSMDNEMEHRQEHREMVDMTVLLNTPDAVTRYGRILNMSKSGATIILNGGAVKRHSILEMKLPPVRRAPRSQKISIRGYVVWTKGNRIGLLWVEDEVATSLLPATVSTQSTPMQLMLIAQRQGK
jgi:hypothetical protein